MSQAIALASHRTPTADDFSLRIFRAARVGGWLGLFVLMSLGAAVDASAADVSTPAAQPTTGAHDAALSIEGDWLVQSRDAVVHIARVGNRFEGRIAWQLHDTYGPEDGPTLDGKVVTDTNNPDPGLRSQPLTGSRLLWGLRYDPAGDRWVDGQVYDADNGRTFDCHVRMTGPNQLKLRGFLGFSLLGGSTLWTRVRMIAAASSQLPYIEQGGGTVTR